MCILHSPLQRSYLKTRLSWDSRLNWSDGSVADIKWWASAQHSWNGQVILQNSIHGQIEIDASHTGWGAVYKGMNASGLWDIRTSFKSSNHRELLTVF